MAPKRNTFIDGVDLSETTSLIHLLDTADVDDGNEAQVLKHSAYYGENEFSKLLTNKVGYRILSINIQIINAKFDEFEAFINRMNVTNPISTICLQECWLNENVDINMFKMINYNLIHQATQCCEHGGLIIYVNEQLKCTKSELIIEQTSGWEYLCIEISSIKQPSTKHVLCNVYRKPNDLRDEFELFATQFSSLVTNIKNIKRTSHICGDFNIDLLKSKERNTTMTILMI